MSAELECIHMCMHFLTSRLTHAYGMFSATIFFSTPSHNSCLHVNTQAPAELKSNGHLRKLQEASSPLCSYILNLVYMNTMGHLDYTF